MTPVVQSRACCSWPGTVWTNVGFGVWERVRPGARAWELALVRVLVHQRARAPRANRPSLARKSTSTLPSMDL
jgi:hypothetical protein